MTVKTYEKYPQFINTDPRLDRSGWYRGYSVNSQFMEDRHYSFFYEYDLTNKTVLDIGCCGFPRLKPPENLTVNLSTHVDRC